jgi:hypothetical protein
LRDDARHAFDPSEAATQSIQGNGSPLVAKSHRELAEKSSQARHFVNQLDALRSGAGGVPSERLPVLFQAVRRETDVPLTHTFQKAAADYATGAMPPDAFNAACHKQARAIGMSWSQKYYLRRHSAPADPAVIISSDGVLPGNRCRPVSTPPAVCSARFVSALSASLLNFASSNPNNAFMVR